MASPFPSSLRDATFPTLSLLCQKGSKLDAERPERVSRL